MIVSDSLRRWALSVAVLATIEIVLQVLRVVLLITRGIHDPTLDGLSSTFLAALLMSIGGTAASAGQNLGQVLNGNQPTPTLPPPTVPPPTVPTPQQPTGTD